LLLVILLEAPAALRQWHDRRDRCLFAVLLLLAPVAETTFVSVGVWRYANSTFLGIPVWFPPAFATAGLAAERLTHALSQVRE
jgi:hypothetical protein